MVERKNHNLLISVQFWISTQISTVVEKIFGSLKFLFYLCVVNLNGQDTLVRESRRIERKTSTEVDKKKLKN